MLIDEAIQYYEEISAEYKQLAEWLNELKHLKSEKEKMIDTLSEKMADICMCPNERDIILRIVGGTTNYEVHCNTDCNHTGCESYHYATKESMEKRLTANQATSARTAVLTKGRDRMSKDTIYRQAAIDALLEEVRLVDGYYVENDEVINKDDAVEAIRLLPPAQPESEPIDPNERDIEILSALRSNYCCFDEKEERVYHALSEAIKAINALEQPEKVDTPTVDTPNCEDAVSRQSAIDACIRVREHRAYDEIEEIKALPPVKPERKKGKWIEYDYGICECPFCHEEWSYFDNEVECFNFCPSCGEEMEGQDG